MPKYQKKRSLKAGLPPGSLLYIGDKESEATVIELFDYNETDYRENKYEATQVDKFKLSPSVIENGIRWINIDGLKNSAAIQQICQNYHIHALVLEDIFNTAQRAKIENYDDYLYIVAKMVYFSNGSIVNEQVSFILGQGYIISIGETKGDVFDKIRDRIRFDGMRIRRHGPDYLAYEMIDAIVDGYFTVLEELGDKIDEGEEALLSNPTIEYMQSLQGIKKELLFLHKSIWPLREVASWMERTQSSLIENTTQIYIRDVYDHIIQSIDTTETFRELISGLMDVYLSSISNKMNNVMKVLTIISTIFIPLTFIAGIYGMNFKYMPELNWKYGYAGLIVVMILIAGLMIAYFKKKKWF